MEIKPNEICFLNYINGLDHSNNLPDYWKYSYGINPAKVVKKLEDYNLIEFKLDIKKNISNLTIPELKEILKENDLLLKGKKQDLIYRIFENIDLSYLEQKYSTKRYCLTDKGNQIIQENYLFIINHKENYNFNDNDIIEIYNKYPKFEDMKKLILLFEYVINKDIINKSFSDLELRIHQLYNLYLKIDLYDKALFYYIIYFKLKLYNIWECDGKIYVNRISDINFENIFIKNLKNVIELNDISLEVIKNIIFTEEITRTIPFKYFNNEECYRILCDLLNNIKFDFNNYNINKPNSNNPNYIYYDFYFYNDELPKQKNQDKISLAKVGLAISTGGLSLLSTGLHKKNKYKN